MATSKRRSAERAPTEHAEQAAGQPHPLSRKAQPVAAAPTQAAIPDGLQAIEAQRRAAIEAQEHAASAAHRVESGVSIDGRKFPRSTVEVIQRRRQS